MKKIILAIFMIISMTNVFGTEVVLVKKGMMFHVNLDGYSTKNIEIINDFYIGKYEVTQEEFEKIMGYNNSTEKSKSMPVNNVKEREAFEFCNKLSKAEGIEPYYIPIDEKEKGYTINKNSLGYRLPSIFEFRYAAYGGTKLKNNNAQYSLEDGWYEDNSNGKIHKVGMKKPNLLGLYDTYGNVSEYVFDGEGIVGVGSSIYSSEAKKGIAIEEFDDRFEEMGFRIAKSVSGIK